jgi:ATP-dependent Lon protease
MAILSAPDLQEIPVLPVRGFVVFPNTVTSLPVGRKQSIQALEVVTTYSDSTESINTPSHEISKSSADSSTEQPPVLPHSEGNLLTKEKQILLVVQKNPEEDYPKEDSLYRVGTLATVLQLVRVPDGTVRVLVEGVRRCKIEQILERKIPEKEATYLAAKVIPIEIPPIVMDQKTKILMRTILSQFEQYIKLEKKIPVEILSALADIEDPNRMADMITMNLNLRTVDKQEILELFPLKPRLEKLLFLLENELDLLQVQKRLRNRLKKQVEKNQREYYLNEQIKAIQKELDTSQGVGTEQEQLADRVNKAKMPKEAKKKAIAELNKLKAMPAMSAEATVSRNYLEALLTIPWTRRCKINYDLKQARAVLNKAHYGLEKVKERFVEFLAVHKRVQHSRGPILCLVGPPGVGKTSLGQAIAEAIACKFVRASLGGVRDEAEIRGHRRTYIGSMPGQIMQKIAKAGVKNPLFMLDEIDKMAMDFRGDPASALLEVLDPEQNRSFNDHYLDVDYDLSEVLFIATANTLDIPPALLDRMEIIRISGYTEAEKAHIAMRHLLPKQRTQNGLKSQELTITLQTLQAIIRYYTREAGVRQLERELAKLCRKAVMILSNKPKRKKIVVTPQNLEQFLGSKRFRYGLAEQENQIGRVSGLAWTEIGGELMPIEAAIFPGKGKLNYTGHLGEIMRESIQAALTVVKCRSKAWGIDSSIYEGHDIHIHVPEGATPKDGPSAGIGMCTAFASVLANKSVRAEIAMTGEITLRGEVLPIGGLKEKLLAAHRGGIREVIIPEENKRDLNELPKNITQDLKIHPVRWIEQVLSIALCDFFKTGYSEKKSPIPLGDRDLSISESEGLIPLSQNGEIRAN